MWRIRTRPKVDTSVKRRRGSNQQSTGHPMSRSIFFSSNINKSNDRRFPDIEALEDIITQLSDIAHSLHLPETAESLQGVLCTIPKHAQRQTSSSGIPNTIHQFSIDRVFEHEIAYRALLARYHESIAHNANEFTQTQTLQPDDCFEALVQLTWKIAEEPARSIDALKAKCRVLADWAGDEAEDLVDQFAAAVCRDVAEMTTEP